MSETHTYTYMHSDEREDRYIFDSDTIVGAATTTSALHQTLCHNQTFRPITRVIPGQPTPFLVLLKKNVRVVILLRYRLLGTRYSLSGAKDGEGARFHLTFIEFPYLSPPKGLFRRLPPTETPIKWELSPQI